MVGLLGFVDVQDALLQARRGRAHDVHIGAEVGRRRRCAGRQRQRSAHQGASQGGGGARARNIGWRIDYFVVDQPLYGKVKDMRHLNDHMGSDHCPIVLDIAL